MVYVLLCCFAIVNDDDTDKQFATRRTPALADDDASLLPHCEQYLSPSVTAASQTWQNIVSTKERAGVGLHSIEYPPV